MGKAGGKELTGGRRGVEGSLLVGLLASLLIGLLSGACDPSAPTGLAPAGGIGEDPPPPLAPETQPLHGDRPADADAPPPPPPEDLLAQLSPDQVAQLNSLGIPVVVPEAVPPSFQVADLRITQGDMGLGYLIVYQSVDHQCFAVEYADGGTSPPPATDHRIPIQPPLFTQGSQDYGLNYGQFADPDWRAKFPEPNLYTDWLAGPAGDYRLTGAEDIKALFATFETCQDIDPQTAVELVESFTLLSPASQTSSIPPGGG